MDTLGSIETLNECLKNLGERNLRKVSERYESGV